MTNEEARAIGERLKKCDGFRWIPGMANMRGEVCVAVNPGRKEDVAFGDCFGTIWASGEDCVPDVREPGTRGGVVALTREAWGREGITTELVQEESGEWWWGVMAWTWTEDGYTSWSPTGGSSTEAEALAAALEAAPSKGAA